MTLPSFYREICTIDSAGTARLRVQHSSYKNPRTSRSASVFAVYQRNVPARRTETIPTCRSFSRWCDSVDAGIPNSSCNSPATIPVGCAERSKRTICRRGSAPRAAKRSAHRVTSRGSGFLMFRLLQKYGRMAISSTLFSRRASYFRVLLPAIETPAFSLLTAFLPHGILTCPGLSMKLKRIVFTVIVAALGGVAALAQSPSPSAPAAQEKLSPRAEAYYNFALGHIYEQQFELTSQNELATKAIEAYKKAYAIDPQSPIIGERLAEMYWKAQRVHDAMVEANEILKRDPNDLATHRLLARIYLRSLGDINGSGVQTEMVSKAIAEYSEVHRLDPTDQEAALWLARLYRLHNEPDKAEKVLLGMLKDDPENEAAVEQLTQLYLDENKSEESIALLEGMISRSPSATLYDLLGDAYTQTHEYGKAEKAYRKAVDLDPAELGHLRGLGQTLLSEEKYPDALSVYQKLADLMPDD